MHMQRRKKKIAVHCIIFIETDVYKKKKMNKETTVTEIKSKKEKKLHNEIEMQQFHFNI